ncbi:hypothetical protein [Chromobacterium haemolyticum]|uniref:hypothetical protein n=1 Tax=Chromobacterium haemolyticum TaxID=394935 RepID=UPI0011304CC4|nr:hypothetical protein [Chromobacterium haemolyticum]
MGNTKLQDIDKRKVEQQLVKQDATEPANKRLQFLLGKPDDKVSLQSGREVWVYRSDKYKPSWQNFTNISLFFRSQVRRIIELVVVFSQNGEALQWRLVEDYWDEDTGLINKRLGLPASSDWTDPAPVGIPAL